MNDFDYTCRKLSKCLYLYLGRADSRGLGVFAAKRFEPGEIVMTDQDGDYYDNVVSYDELCRRGYGLDITLQVGLDKFKLPTGSLEDFTNHSCDPNTGIRLNGKGTIIVALRAIVPHEELTYDYSTYLNNPFERMTCHCGVPVCRGVIGNFGGLPVTLQRRYRDLAIIGDFVDADLEPKEVAS